MYQRSELRQTILRLAVVFGNFFEVITGAKITTDTVNNGN